TMRHLRGAQETVLHYKARLAEIYAYTENRVRIDFYYYSVKVLREDSVVLMNMINSKVDEIDELSTIEKQGFKRSIYVVLKEVQEIREKLCFDDFKEMKPQIIEVREKTHQLKLDVEWLSGESFYRKKK